VGRWVRRACNPGAVPSVPADPTEADFLAAVLRNPKVVEVLAGAERLDLPDWYLAAGCLSRPCGTSS
jgi:hypothetical protein